MSKRDKRRAQFEAKYADDERGTPAPYSQSGSNEWLASYPDGTFEFFYRDRTGLIRGAGAKPTVDLAGCNLFRCHVLDMRPPLHVGASAKIATAYEQGYFVVPSAMGEAE